MIVPDRSSTNPVVGHIGDLTVDPTCEAIIRHFPELRGKLQTTATWDLLNGDAAFQETIFRALCHVSAFVNRLRSGRVLPRDTREYLNDFLQGTFKSIRHAFLYEGVVPMGLTKQDLARFVDHGGHLDEVDWNDARFGALIELARNVRAVDDIPDALDRLLYLKLTTDPLTRHRGPSWRQRILIPNLSKDLASQYVQLISRAL